MKSAIGNRQSAMGSLGLFMTRMLAATSTEFTEFQPIGRGLLILGRHVVPTLAIVTLKHNVIAWHNSFPISNFRLLICSIAVPKSEIGNRQSPILLFNNFRNGSRSYRATAFANSEP